MFFEERVADKPGGICNHSHSFILDDLDVIMFDFVLMDQQGLP